MVEDETGSKETPSVELSREQTETRPSPNREGLADLESLYKEHSRLVYLSAYRVTGRGADAEDVLQTIFLRLARRPDDLERLGKNPRGYFHRAALNAALDVVRSRAVSNTTSLGDSDEPTSPASPDQAPLRRELREALRGAISRLSAKSAEMFVLRYFDGLDNGEIARLLETSTGTVTVQLFRIRRQLQNELRAFAR